MYINITSLGVLMSHDESKLFAASSNMPSGEIPGCDAAALSPSSISGDILFLKMFPYSGHHDFHTILGYSFKQQLDFKNTLNYIFFFSNNEQWL